MRVSNKLTGAETGKSMDLKFKPGIKTLAFKKLVQLLSERWDFAAAWQEVCNMAYAIPTFPLSLLAAGMNADGMTAKYDDGSSLSSQGNKTYKLTLLVMRACTGLTSCWLISTKVGRVQKISSKISS